MVRVGVVHDTTELGRLATELAVSLELAGVVQAQPHGRRDPELRDVCSVVEPHPSEDVQITPSFVRCLSR